MQAAQTLNHRRTTTDKNVKTQHVLVTVFVNRYIHSNLQSGLVVVGAARMPAMYREVPRQSTPYPTPPSSFVKASLSASSSVSCAIHPHFQQQKADKDI